MNLFLLINKGGINEVKIHATLATYQCGTCAL